MCSVLSQLTVNICIVEVDNELEPLILEIWEKNKISWSKKRETWSQSVYQVDDSPRYQSYGKWVHTENFSSWTSNETWRQLPRREYSVRDDYDVIIGFNTQTITPT